MKVKSKRPINKGFLVSNSVLIIPPMRYISLKMEELVSEQTPFTYIHIEKYGK